MDFSFTEEQTLLRNSVSKYLADNYKVEDWRKFTRSDAGRDPRHWKQFAELGLLAASLPEVECLLVTKDGGRVESKGWRALEAPLAPRADLVATPPAAPQAWDQSLELIINLELARIEGHGYRRPYVAVWVEDKDRFLVRTLALWYQKPRWLPELKSWSRANRLRAMAGTTDLAGSVSSATRPAGKYTLKWDGKDNQGRPAPSGKYTVFIEAAREHGTYQLMRQEIDFNGEPKQFNLTGNVEIASASLDYRKKSR